MASASAFAQKLLNPRAVTLPGVWLSEPGEEQLAVKNGVQRESLRSQPIGSRLKWFQSCLPVRICYLATFHCHTAHCNRAVLPSLLPYRCQFHCCLVCCPVAPKSPYSPSEVFPSFDTTPKQLLWASISRRPHHLFSEVSGRVVYVFCST